MKWFKLDTKEYAQRTFDTAIGDFECNEWKNVFFFKEAHLFDLLVWIGRFQMIQRTYAISRHFTLLNCAVDFCFKLKSSLNGNHGKKNLGNSFDDWFSSFFRFRNPWKWFSPWFWPLVWLWAVCTKMIIGWFPYAETVKTLRECWGIWLWD